MSQKIHISAVCGTFMGGIAQLAKQKGFVVSGSDKNCYPPMSDQLQQAGIELQEGFRAENLQPEPDCVVIGNAMSRGNPEVEYVLERGLNYRSGPQWLAENILQDKWVIAVAGTHGKTTTSSMVAWILEYAGLNPGFLIGGVPENFGVSARLTDSIFFVVEADEYDTAFFDKRSKFVHYRARTTVLNNLEFDHADIFDDITAIETQFHHLVRTIPGNGLVIHPQDSESLNRVLQRGCWTPCQSMGEQGDWAFDLINDDGSCFDVTFKGKVQGRVNWQLIGLHNVHNALAAIAAAHHAGVTITDAIDGINQFKSVKRRMELKGRVNGVSVYDDFAHHPTAIELTVQGLRASIKDSPMIAVVDVRSNTMRMGYHKDNIIPAMQAADVKIIHDPQHIDWGSDETVIICETVEQVIQQIGRYVTSNSHVLLMSNGAFGGIYDTLLATLQKQSFSR
ncbi:UDP-N-acetylmuramate:L-alanyl-gamma-D-glutamyl-meso-diaminopimelate ligase [Pleionea mediterranea]|uniref:UDP-N-acetylmuramate--L-alanyl-gamma-D-glutamyl-meso-2,6-diaminoheptandioate ligase n=1 Tax=Pleionea mediterranea TaxID=523701 RepID=A0A316G3Q9_9GAMM|nr:UDP-N-acetylmuramate:L-alanyl-gamma-D-glutamyl-meso-diaminopimelate ligase [Pleionea mediterranea]PWK54420.1 UDP-N-acetylmuramate: L-alanyl-gamma-D-glutamyl-meso-diaminopimelate ligase [Pleionea mediterranea]